MSSDDVIELGSSDEDTEPAPKKKRPMPNAMVCIPRRLHDVTIKPAKKESNDLPKELIGKAITVKKVKPQTVNKNKINGKPVIQPQKLVHPPVKPQATAQFKQLPNRQAKPQINSQISVKKQTNPQLNPKLSINPFSKVTKPILIQSKSVNSKNAIVKPGNYSNTIKSPININTLPSGITVKKSVSNRPIVMLNVKNKQLTHQSNTKIGEVLTVELDDDDTPIKNSSPQWYLRPEDQTESTEIEEENNKEPEASNLIEITIEESPVKSVVDKRTHEVGVELPITIEDSPLKAVSKKTPVSDDEKKPRTHSPNSRKKLEYPKEEDNKQIVEIEIPPLEINENNNKTTETVVSLVEEDKNVVEILSDTKPTVAPKESVKEDERNTSSSEFHPVYQKFIDLCFKLENSDDMKKIVEKKIKGYYKQVPKEYTESEEFIDMVSSKILSMKAGPEKMFLFIKDIVDELNLQRKLAKSRPIIDTKTEVLPEIAEEESEYDSKRQRQIRKLEKTIKKLHRAIQKLEEQEVDFDDEDDSVYLLTERYKERMVRVYAKFCQLSNTKMPSEPRIQIDARPGQPSGPAKRLEKWVNKKVPIGTPLPFPDFHDVLRCVRESNDEDKLGFNEADIMEEARDLFTRCGRKLQRRRQENEWRIAASRLPADGNAHENNVDLQKKLNENKQIAAQKETEIFNKFADRQNQLKLEGEEIGDKEADESPVESEEETEREVEDVSLENTEKRKERLKRLLHEKSKKVPGDKENQPSNDDNGNEDTQISENTESNTKTEETAETDKKEPEENIKESADKSEEKEKDDTPTKDTETLVLSDDSNAVESDIDELHLLQKLHSENENQDSTMSSSDSESPINISDSLASSEDNEGQVSDGVISIENSSYSEDEDDKIDNTQTSNTGSVQIINDDSLPNDISEMIRTGSLQIINEDIMPNETSQMVNETSEMITNEDVPANNDEPMDVDPLYTEETHAPPQSNNEEYTEAVEDILLASSEEDNSQDGNTVCVNLGDALISIDETVVGNINNKCIEHEDEILNEELAKNVEENTSIQEKSDSDTVGNTKDISENEKSKEVSNIDEIILDELSADSTENTNSEKCVSDVNELNKTINSEDILPSTSIQ